VEGESKGLNAEGKRKRALVRNGEGLAEKEGGQEHCRNLITQKKKAPRHAERETVKGGKNQDRKKKNSLIKESKET